MRESDSQFGEINQKRIGFLEGQIKAPADFDQIGQDEIIEMFEGFELIDELKEEI
jgi:hypothetical protein